MQICMSKVHEINVSCALSDTVVLKIIQEQNWHFIWISTVGHAADKA